MALTIKAPDVDGNEDWSWGVRVSYRTDLGWEDHHEESGTFSEDVEVLTLVVPTARVIKIALTRVTGTVEREFKTMGRALPMSPSWGPEPVSIEPCEAINFDPHFEVERTLKFGILIIEYEWDPGEAGAKAIIKSDFLDSPVEESEYVKVVNEGNRQTLVIDVKTAYETGNWSVMTHILMYAAWTVPGYRPLTINAEYLGEKKTIVRYLSLSNNGEAYPLGLVTVFSDGRFSL